MIRRILTRWWPVFRPLKALFSRSHRETVQGIDSYKSIRRLLNTLALDIVLVADANVPVKHWEALASLCEKELIQFKVVPSYFSVLVSGLYPGDAQWNSDPGCISPAP